MKMVANPYKKSRVSDFLLLENDMCRMCTTSSGVKIRS